MKTHLALSSRLIVITLFAINFLTVTAHAQRAKVIKVKGQQAIVQFPSGARPEVGQTLSVEDGSEQFSPELASSSRRFIVGGSANLSSLNNSTTNKNTTDFGFTGRYGWNMVEWEAGPLATFDYSTTDSYSSRTISAGGFYDYDLMQNKPGTPLVYGFGTLLTIGQLSTTSNGTNTTSSVVHLFGGGQLKWYPLKNSVALRADAGLDHTTTSGNTTTTVSGLLVSGGLYVYF